jgi:hypothetical protein
VIHDERPEPDHRPFTEAEARAAANRLVVAAEVEGCWEALCRCGQPCGLSLVEPDERADTRYLACPACGASNAAEPGAIRWESHP